MITYRIKEYAILVDAYYYFKYREEEKEIDGLDSCFNKDNNSYSILQLCDMLNNSLLNWKKRPIIFTGKK